MNPLERAQAMEDLAMRAERVLDPYGFGGGSMADDMGHALDVIDRLAARVAELEEGIRALADSNENRMTYLQGEARNVAAKTVVRLRALLPPTPEAPDGQ